MTTSYYTDYRAKATQFTTTVQSGDSPTTATTYRIATTNTSMGRFQGINKGNNVTNNTTNMNTRMGTFNANAGGNYVSWKRDGSFFTFMHRHHVSLQRIGNVLNTNITNEYTSPTPTYTYKWYLNGVEQMATTSSINVPPMRYVDHEYIVIVTSSGYAATSTIKIAKTVDVKLIRNGTNLNANLVGESHIVRRS